MTATETSRPDLGLAAAASDADERRVVVRSRLFRKYVALFVVVVSAALAVSGILEIYFLYQEQKLSLAAIQNQQAQSAADKMDDFIKEIQGQLGWTTQLPWSTGPLDQRRFDALRLLRQVPAITELSQLDATGHEQLHVSRLAMDVIGSGLDLSNDPKFTRTVAAKTYFGPVYFRRDSEPYMAIAVAGTRKDAGVSVAEVNLKFIWDVVSQIKVGDTGHAFVIDSQGRLIAHPDISLVLRNTDLSSLPQVQAVLHDKDPGDNVVRDFLGQYVVTSNAAIPTLGWHVFVELPLNEALKPLYASIARTGLLLLMGLAIAFTAGLFLAGRMVVPIRLLRDGAAKIGSGDLARRINIRTGDELEALAFEFNHMAARLQDSYADLERKVENRTQELARSVVELRALGHQLERASQHKSQFLANMSHELRTPLNAILGYAELVVDGLYGELPVKAHEVIERIQVNGRHLLGLINDVLDIAKIEAGQLTLAIEEYEFGTLIEAVLASTESLAKTKGLALKSSVAPNLPTGRGDVRRITQVLLNLVGNAIKFTEAGFVAITVEQIDRRFVFSVQDTGPGIAPDDQARIFQEFQQVDSSSTRSKGGTGLGLAIAQRIVEMHGGSIAVESTLGAGSTFRVELPVEVMEMAATQ